MTAPLWNTRGDRCPVCGKRPTGCTVNVLSATRLTPTLTRVDEVGTASLEPCGHEVTPVATGETPTYPQEAS